MNRVQLEGTQGGVAACGALERLGRGVVTGWLLLALVSVAGSREAPPSGAATSLGEVGARVNRWPLYYERSGTGSFLWPFGAFSETHVAVHPLLALHRSARGQPFHEIRVLFPFARFDLESRRHHAFPFFWGPDYTVGFPLYWRFGRPYDGPSGFSALLPLWMYERSPDSSDLGILWPVFRRSRGSETPGWQLWPLYGRWVSHGEDSLHNFWLWPLGARVRTPDSLHHRFLPFYALDRSEEHADFLSLPWVDLRSPERRVRAVPPLLSWHRTRADGAYSLDLALGLYRHAVAADDARSGRLLPLYAYNPRWFVSVVYGRAQLDDATLRMAPALLSWQWSRASGERSDYWLGGLYHRRRGVPGEERDWLLPLYYRDRREALILSPLYASAAVSETARVEVVPPLLAWRRTDAASGERASHALGGLIHRRRGVAGRERDWLLPLYLRDREEGLLLTPFWARRSGAGVSAWQAIPPLLSWYSRDAGDGAGSLYLLSGLVHRRRGAAGRDRDWVLPFYYRDEESGLLASPFYLAAADPEGITRWEAVPPLLSFRTFQAETGARSLYAAGGLWHRRRGEPALDRDWLLPLYYREPSQGLLLTPVYAARRGEDQALEWSAAPPLLTWHRALRDGSRDTFALGGLMRFGRDGEGRPRGWVLPLLRYGPGFLLSPLYADWRQNEGQPGEQRIRAVPPLLSWQRRDVEGGRGDRYALLGLARWRIGVPSDEAAGHLFPLILFDRRHDLWLTPLLGRWHDGGSRYRYWATPLVGTFDGRFRGFWMFPLGGRSTAPGLRSEWLLWGRRERHADGRRSISFFPLFHHLRQGESGPIERFARQPRDRPAEIEPASAMRRWSLLLGLCRGRSTWTLRAARRNTCTEQHRRRLFPLWRSRQRVEIDVTDGIETARRTTASRKAALWLFEDRRESDTGSGRRYRRTRVLGHLVDYERLNDDVSVDVFPAISWDRRADGRRRTSVLWRLYRSEVDAEGRRWLDVLFLPLRRPGR